jgi:hypothetical protein
VTFSVSCIITKLQLEVIVYKSTVRLSLGLSVCLFIAVAIMLSNAVSFQFTGSRELGLGDEIVKPNTDGLGHDYQAVDIDPSPRESTSKAAVFGRSLRSLLSAWH